MYKFLYKKITAILVIVTLCFSEITFAAPSVMPAPSPASEVNTIHSTMELPSALGHMEILEKPANASHPTLIHIQDAHGNASAQHNIEKILIYLNQQQKVELFLEGAIDEVKPELLVVMEDPDQDREAAEILLEQGLYDGPSLFLLDNFHRKQDRVRAHGVEDPEIYIKNLRYYRELKYFEDEIQQYILTVEQMLSSVASNLLSKPLGDFFKSWIRFSQQPNQLEQYAKLLQETALNSLSLDLTNARNQINWPQTVRFLKLRELESSLDLEKAKEQFNQFQILLQEARIAEAFVNMLDPSQKTADTPDHSLREVIEIIFDQTARDKFDFTDYPEWINWAALQILGSELDAQELFSELAKLSFKIFQELAVSDQEKKFLQSYEAFKQQKGALELTLTRNDYDSLKARIDDVKPSNWFQNMRLMAPEFKDLSQNISKHFKIAFLFYETALKRDRVMFEHLKQNQSDAFQPVLVSGGFHSEGLRLLCRNEGYGYVSVLPRIAELGTSREYKRTMLLQSDSLARRSSVDIPQAGDTAMAALLPDYWQQLKGSQDFARQTVERNYSLRSEHRSDDQDWAPWEELIDLAAIVSEITERHREFRKKPTTSGQIWISDALNKAEALYAKLNRRANREPSIGNGAVFKESLGVKRKELDRVYHFPFKKRGMPLYKILTASYMGSFIFGTLTAMVMISNLDISAEAKGAILLLNGVAFPLVVTAASAIIYFRLRKTRLKKLEEKEIAEDQQGRSEQRAKPKYPGDDVVGELLKKFHGDEKQVAEALNVSVIVLEEWMYDHRWNDLAEDYRRNHFNQTHPKPDEAQFMKAFLEERGRAVRLSERFGVSVDEVLRWIQSYGVYELYQKNKADHYRNQPFLKPALIYADRLDYLLARFGIVAPIFRHKKYRAEEGLWKLKDRLVLAAQSIREGHRAKPYVLVITGPRAVGKTILAKRIKEGGLGLRPDEIAVLHHDEYYNWAEAGAARAAKYTPLNLDQYIGNKKIVILEGTEALEYIDYEETDHVVYLRGHFLTRILNLIIRYIEKFTHDGISDYIGQVISIIFSPLTHLSRYVGDVMTGDYSKYIVQSDTILDYSIFSRMHESKIADMMKGSSVNMNPDESSEMLKLERALGSLPHLFVMGLLNIGAIAAILYAAFQTSADNTYAWNAFKSAGTMAITGLFLSLSVVGHFIVSTLKRLRTTASENEKNDQRSEQRAHPAVLQAIDEYSLGSLKIAEEHEGGAGIHSRAIPVFETERGVFGLKRWNVGNTHTMIRLAQFMIELKNMGLSLPVISKTAELRPENLFIAFNNAEAGKVEYFTVERWTEDRTIKRSEAETGQIETVGRLLGRIHREMRKSGFMIGRNDDRYTLLGKGLDILRRDRPKWLPQVRAIATPAQIALVEEIIEEIDEELTEEKLAQFPLQPIMSDMNFGNLKFNQAGDEITALFDLDQARDGYAFEDFTGTTMNSGTQEEVERYRNYLLNYNRDLEALIKGYESTAERKLTAAERRMIPIHTRAMALLFIAHSATPNDQKTEEQIAASMEDNRQRLRNLEQYAQTEWKTERREDRAETINEIKAAFSQLVRDHYVLLPGENGYAELMPGPTLDEEYFDLMAEMRDAGVGGFSQTVDVPVDEESLYRDKIAQHIQVLDELAGWFGSEPNGLLVQSFNRDQIGFMRLMSSLTMISGSIERNLEDAFIFDFLNIPAVQKLLVENPKALGAFFMDVSFNTPEELARSYPDYIDFPAGDRADAEEELDQFLDRYINQAAELVEKIQNDIDLIKWHDFVSAEISRERLREILFWLIEARSANDGIEEELRMQNVHLSELPYLAIATVTLLKDWNLSDFHPANVHRVHHREINWHLSKFPKLRYLEFLKKDKGLDLSKPVEADVINQPFWLQEFSNRFDADGLPRAELRVKASVVNDIRYLVSHRFYEPTDTVFHDLESILPKIRNIMNILEPAEQRVLKKRWRLLDRKAAHARERWAKDVVWLASMRLAQLTDSSITAQRLIHDIAAVTHQSVPELSELHHELNRNWPEIRQRLLTGQAIQVFGREARFDPISAGFIVRTIPNGKSLENGEVAVRGPPKVVLSILVRNRWSEAAALLDSLAKIQTPNVELVILDNDSGNFDPDLIRHFSSQSKIPVTILRSSENLGFDEGHNVIVDMALDKRHADYIFTMNDDLIVDEHFVDGLLELYQNQEINGDRRIGFAGPAVFDLESDIKTDKLQHYGARYPKNALTLKSTLAQDFEDPANLPKNLKVDYVIGPVQTFSTQALRYVGPYDARIFAYGEELDMAVRLEEAGFISYVTSQSKVWHSGAQTSGGKVSPFVVRQTITNNILLLKKHADLRDLKSFIRLTLSMILISYKSLRAFTRNRDFAQITAIFAGFLNGILARYSTVQADWRYSGDGLFVAMESKPQAFNQKAKDSLLRELRDIYGAGFARVSPHEFPGENPDEIEVSVRVSPGDVVDVEHSLEKRFEDFMKVYPQYEWKEGGKPAPSMSGDLLVFTPVSLTLRLRSEQRSVIDPDADVFKLYPSGSFEAQLLVNSYPNGKLHLDHTTRRLTWQDDDGQIIEEQAMRDQGLEYQINLPWSELESGLDTLGTSADVYSYHNLYFNDWFVAYDGESKTLFRHREEPIDRRVYSMAVIWKDKAKGVTSENLVFETEQDLIRIYRTEDELRTTDLAGQIDQAFLGQRLIHLGQDTALEEIAHQFSDIFQLYKFPQFVTITGAGADIEYEYGRTIGVDEFVQLRDTNQDAFKAAVRSGGRMQIDLKPYLAEFSLDSIKEKALGHRGYQENISDTLDQFKAGDYRVEGDQLHIKLLPFAYPHNAIGLTRSGKPFAIVINGDKFEERGSSVQQIPAKVRELYAAKVGQAAASADPIEELFLLANSRDAFRRRVANGKGRFLEKNPRPYERATAALAFVRLTVEDEEIDAWLAKGEGQTKIHADSGESFLLSYKNMGRLNDFLFDTERLTISRDGADIAALYFNYSPAENKIIVRTAAFSEEGKRPLHPFYLDALYAQSFEGLGETLFYFSKRIAESRNALGIKVTDAPEDVMSASGFHYSAGQQQYEQSVRFYGAAALPPDIVRRSEQRAVWWLKLKATAPWYRAGKINQSTPITRLAKYVLDETRQKESALAALEDLIQRDSLSLDAYFDLIRALAEIRDFTTDSEVSRRALNALIKFFRESPPALIGRVGSHTVQVGRDEMAEVARVFMDLLFDSDSKSEEIRVESFRAFVRLALEDNVPPETVNFVLMVLGRMIMDGATKSTYGNRDILDDAALSMIEIMHKHYENETMWDSAILPFMKSVALIRDYIRSFKSRIHPELPRLITEKYQRSEQRSDGTGEDGGDLSAARLENEQRLIELARLNGGKIPGFETKGKNQKGSGVIQSMEELVDNIASLIEAGNIPFTSIEIGDKNLPAKIIIDIYLEQADPKQWLATVLKKHIKPEDFEISWSLNDAGQLILTRSEQRSLSPYLQMYFEESTVQGIHEEAMAWMESFSPADLKYWIFRKGMRFGDQTNWWGAHQARPEPLGIHTGLDFAIYEDWEARMNPVAEELPVPAMSGGTIAAVFEDDMQTSLIIRTGRFDHKGREKIHIYMHFEPAQEFNPGDVIKTGQVFGYIKRSRNQTSVVSQHLHLSAAFAEPEFLDTWSSMKLSPPVLDEFAHSKKLEYFDPLELFLPKTISGWARATPYTIFNEILLVDDHENVKFYPKRQPIERAFPGVATPVAKSVKRAREILFDLERSVDVVVVTTPELQKEMREVVIDHENVLMIGETPEGRRTPVIFYDADNDPEGEELVKNLIRVSRVGALFDRPVTEYTDAFGSHVTRLTERLERTGIDTLGKLTDLINDAELFKSMVPDEADRWDLLDIIAQQNAEAISVDVLFPPYPVNTPEPLVPASYASAVRLMSVWVTRLKRWDFSIQNLEDLVQFVTFNPDYQEFLESRFDHDFVAFLRPLVRLMPDELEMHVVAPLFLPEVRSRITSGGARTFQDFVDMINVEPQVFLKLFPLDYERSNVLWTIAQLGPWLIDRGVQENEAYREALFNEPNAIEGQLGGYNQLRFSMTEKTIGPAPAGPARYRSEQRTDIIRLIDESESTQTKITDLGISHFIFKGLAGGAMTRAARILMIGANAADIRNIFEFNNSAHIDVINNNLAELEAIQKILPQITYLSPRGENITGVEERTTLYLADAAHLEDYRDATSGQPIFNEDQYKFIYVGVDSSAFSFDDFDIRDGIMQAIADQAMRAVKPGGLVFQIGMDDQYYLPRVESGEFIQSKDLFGQAYNGFRKKPLTPATAEEILVQYALGPDVSLAYEAIKALLHTPMQDSESYDTPAVSGYGSRITHQEYLERYVTEKTERFKTLPLPLKIRNVSPDFPEQDDPSWFPKTKGVTLSIEVEREGKEKGYYTWSRGPKDFGFEFGTLDILGLPHKERGYKSEESLGYSLDAEYWDYELAGFLTWMLHDQLPDTWRSEQRIDEAMADEEAYRTLRSFVEFVPGHVIGHRSVFSDEENDRRAREFLPNFRFLLAQGFSVEKIKNNPDILREDVQTTWKYLTTDQTVQAGEQNVQGLAIAEKLILQNITLLRADVESLNTVWLYLTSPGTSTHQAQSYTNLKIPPDRIRKNPILLAYSIENLYKTWRFLTSEESIEDWGQIYQGLNLDEEKVRKYPNLLQYGLDNMSDTYRFLTEQLDLSPESLTPYIESLLTRALDLGRTSNTGLRMRGAFFKRHNWDISDKIFWLLRPASALEKRGVNTGAMEVFSTRMWKPRELDFQSFENSIIENNRIKSRVKKREFFAMTRRLRELSDDYLYYADQAQRDTVLAEIKLAAARVAETYISESERSETAEKLVNIAVAERYELRDSDTAELLRQEILTVMNKLGENTIAKKIENFSGVHLERVFLIRSLEGLEAYLRQWQRASALDQAELRKDSFVKEETAYLNDVFDPGDSRRRIAYEIENARTETVFRETLAEMIQKRLKAPDISTDPFLLRFTALGDMREFRYAVEELNEAMNMVLADETLQDVLNAAEIKDKKDLSRSMNFSFEFYDIFSGALGRAQQALVFLQARYDWLDPQVSYKFLNVLHPELITDWQDKKAAVIFVRNIFPEQIREPLRKFLNEALPGLSEGGMLITNSRAANEIEKAQRQLLRNPAAGLSEEFSHLDYISEGRYGDLRSDYVIRVFRKQQRSEQRGKYPGDEAFENLIYEHDAVLSRIAAATGVTNVSVVYWIKNYGFDDIVQDIRSDRITHPNYPGHDAFDEMVRVYAGHLNNLADTLNVSVQTIVRWIRKRQLENITEEVRATRSNSPNYPGDEAFEAALRNHKARLSDVAAEYGVDISTVSRWVKAFGFEELAEELRTGRVNQGAGGRPSNFPGKKILNAALKKAKGDVSVVAREFGLSESTVYGWIRDNQLDSFFADLKRKEKLRKLLTKHRGHLQKVADEMDLSAGSVNRLINEYELVRHAAQQRKRRQVETRGRKSDYPGDRLFKAALKRNQGYVERTAADLGTTAGTISRWTRENELEDYVKQLREARKRSEQREQVYFEQIGRSESAVLYTARIARNVIGEEHRVDSEIFERLLNKLIPVLAEEFKADLNDFRRDIKTRIASLETLLADNTLRFEGSGTVVMTSSGEARQRTNLLLGAIPFFVALSKAEGDRNQFYFVGENADQLKQAVYAKDNGLTDQEKGLVSRILKFATNPADDTGSVLRQQINKNKSIAASLTADESGVLDQAFRTILKAIEDPAEMDATELNYLDQIEAYAARAMLLLDLARHLQINAAEIRNTEDVEKLVAEYLRERLPDVYVEVYADGSFSLSLKSMAEQLAIFRAAAESFATAA